MKFTKKLIAALVVACMVAGLAACGNSGKIESTAAVETTTKAETTKAPAKDDTTAAADVETEDAGLDRSEQINLILYVTGNEPTDMALVAEAFNAILLEKFNATVEIQFSTWTDYTTKYNNTLVTGGCDIIFTADWLSYTTLASQGAFMELDELLPTYAPELYEAIGADKLNQCRVNGKIYCFPNTWDEYVTDGIVYRADLADSLGLAVPEENIENLENYFNGLASASVDDTGLAAMFDATATSNSANTLWNTPSALLVYNWDNEPYLGMNYGYLYDEENPSELVDYYNSEQFVSDALKLKEWCDNGWWTRSILSAESNTTSLTDGTTAATVSGANVNKWTGWVRDINTSGVTNPTTGEAAVLNWYEYSQMNGNSYPVAAIHNGTAIVNGCKYPERAMEVLNCIMTDETVNRLFQCGIEGTHYNFDENGFYVATEQGNNNYSYEAADTWNFRNDTLKLKRESDIEQDKVFARMAEQSSKCLYPLTDIKSGFGEQYESYETERQTVMELLTNNGIASIFAGIEADPEAKIESLRAVLDGSTEWATCRENYTAQWKAYCEEYGYTDSRR